jgi:phycocyanobilin:ferredoxin oxidoreductase
MNCLDLIESIADRLHEIIKSEEDVTAIPTRNYGWINHRYTGPKFRIAHIEIFNQEKFGVVHCCIFPHHDDPAPIFGFDVIAGETKITGVFMDLSPTVIDPIPFTNIDVRRIRDRPEWGDIFSPYWLACRPTFDEMIKIGNEVKTVLSHYLSNSLGNKGDVASITSAQNHYCEQQQKNVHTRRALENLLGIKGTEEFMTEILFPKII